LPYSALVALRVIFDANLSSALISTWTGCKFVIRNENCSYIILKYFPRTDFAGCLQIFFQAFKHKLFYFSKALYSFGIFFVTIKIANVKIVRKFQIDFTSIFLRLRIKK
jgi:hypothetical protein